MRTTLGLSFPCAVRTCAQERARRGVGGRTEAGSQGSELRLITSCSGRRSAAHRLRRERHPGGPVTRLSRSRRLYSPAAMLRTALRATQRARQGQRIDTSHNNLTSRNHVPRPEAPPKDRQIGRASGTGGPGRSMPSRGLPLKPDVEPNQSHARQRQPGWTGLDRAGPRRPRAARRPDPRRRPTRRPLNSKNHVPNREQSRKASRSANPPKGPPELGGVEPRPPLPLQAARRARGGAELVDIEPRTGRDGRAGRGVLPRRCWPDVGSMLAHHPTQPTTNQQPTP